jgi:hypothetical protein
VAHRFVDSLQRLRLHLNERKREIVLRLRFDGVGQRCGVVAGAGSLFANTPDPALTLGQHLAPARHEYPTDIGALLSYPHVCNTDSCAKHGDSPSCVSERLAP